MSDSNHSAKAIEIMHRTTSLDPKQEFPPFKSLNMTLESQKA